MYVEIKIPHIRIIISHKLQNYNIFYPHESISFKIFFDTYGHLLPGLLPEYNRHQALLLPNPQNSYKFKATNSFPHLAKCGFLWYTECVCTNTTIKKCQSHRTRIA